jgi:tetratricopeptide (TPR) repeat protein
MLSFFRRRRLSERMDTSFHWLEPRPFPEAQAEFYSARYERGAYTLALAKESYFAWETMAGDVRHDDFVLEAHLELDPANGHSAAGVIFRHVNDENFYSLLISSRGNFRLDLLFNNHPMHLVEWTQLPEPSDDAPGGLLARTLRITASGSRFLFAVDDEWVGEVEDEVLPAGRIGFAAQNFIGCARGVFRLRRLAVEARPVEVQKERLRWQYYVPVSPAARLRFAETLFASNSFTAAAIQLRKALKGRSGSPREHFLLAECYARLSLHADALEEIEKVLAADPAHADALLEKANLLYLSNRLLEARTHLSAALADGRITAGAGAWNLLGNAEYGLGNWPQAVEAYQHAADLQPEYALFLSNLARSLEQGGRAAEAAQMYVRAARILYAEEAFDELSLLVPRVRALAPRDPEVLAIEAKMLYREGKLDEAFAILRGLAESGSLDSAVHYLLGIILSGRGAREEALPFLSRAAELEPGFALYQFRCAEALHLMGRDSSAQLDKALALAPNDPWTNNLAGQIRIEAGDCEAAAGHLRRAHDAAPAEVDICLNLSEALSLCGKHAEALLVLEGLAANAKAGAPGSTQDAEAGAKADARVSNQKGNVLSRQGDYPRAVVEYEKAIRQDPENPTYKENCAAACLEIDMVHRAEELLSQIEPEHPSASVYNLLGMVAMQKGERARAEIALRSGLELDPGNSDIGVNLAMVYKERGNHEKAREVLLSVLSAAPGSSRARLLLERIRDEHEQRLSCATCGREWWAPKVLPPQPSIRVRGEPPGDAPAGRCPRCGKVYCISCASAHLREMRFFCPECDEFLKLSDDPLKWLLARAVESAVGRAAGQKPSGTGALP